MNFIFSGHKNIVELLLQRPSLDLSKKNNDNKTAIELSLNDEIKHVFKVFLSEKTLSNAKSGQRVQIYETKNDHVKKMFENTGFHIDTRSPTSDTSKDRSSLDVRVCP